MAIEGVSFAVSQPIRGVAFDVAAPYHPAHVIAAFSSASVGTAALSTTGVFATFSSVSTGTASIAIIPAIAAGFTSVSTGAAVLTTNAVVATGFSSVSTGAAAVAQGTPLTLLGSRLHFWFEAGAGGPPSLNGANIIQLNDLSSFGYHLTQGTDGSRPQYSATGGPNNAPQIAFSSGAQNIANTAIALAANKALTFYAVAQQVASATKAQCGARSGTAINTGNILFTTLGTSGNQYLFAAGVNGGTEEDATITSPAGNASWHVWSQAYAASVVPVAKIDNGSVSPAFTVTGKCQTVETILIGHGSAAGGNIYAYFCGEDVTANEDTAIRDYLRAQTTIG